MSEYIAAPTHSSIFYLAAMPELKASKVADLPSFDDFKVCKVERGITNGTYHKCEDHDVWVIWHPES